MAMRPLDRLTSIRAKLGSVIVFAVAVTILIMYIAVGFSLRKFERDRQFNTVLGEAQGVAALGFNSLGQPSKALVRAIDQLDESAVVIDATGGHLSFKNMSVPPSADRTLSGRVAFDPATFGSVIGRLEAKGWVRREADPGDRRRKLLWVTPEGQQIAMQMKRAVSKVQSRLLGPLDDAERAQFGALLGKLIAGHEGME